MLFDQQFGMTPNVFICLCYASAALIFKGDRVLHPSSFKNLSQAFGAGVEKFFDLFSRDLLGLRAELQRPRRPPKLPHLWPPKLLHLAGVS